MRSRIGTALTIPALVASLLVVVAGPAAAVGWHTGRCTPADLNSVTVVVDHQQLGGATVVRCAFGLPTGAKGIDALRAAQISTVGTATDGAGFICRLAGKPTATQVIPITTNPTYRETCNRTPPAAAYWSYWTATAKGNWTYSTRGVLTNRVVFGGFEGWSFSLNATASTNPKPRLCTTTAPCTPR